MEKKFIIVTGLVTGGKIVIDINLIDTVLPYDKSNRNKSTINLNNSKYYSCEESPEEVYELIKQSQNKTCTQ